MPKPHAQWIVLECPACFATLKVGATSADQQLACPDCGVRMSISAQKDQQLKAGVSFRQSKSALPQSRSFDPTPQINQEQTDWGGSRISKQQKPVELEREVALTTESELYVDVSDPQAARAQRKRERHINSIGWEDTKAEPVVSSEALAEAHARMALGWPYWATLYTLIASAIILGGTWGYRRTFAKGGSSQVTSSKGELTLSASAIEALRETGQIEEKSSMDSVGPRVYEFVADTDMPKIRQSMQAFAEAENPAAMLLHIRQPERVGPLLKAWYERYPFERRKVESYPEQAGIYTYKAFRAGSVSLDNGDRRVIALIKTAKGDWLVDWEAYVGWCEIGWEDLPVKRPQNPTLLRCRVSPTEYYNMAYSDESRYFCYQLSSFRGEHIVYGYIKRDSRLFWEMDAKVRTGRQSFIIVKVHYRDEISKSPNQVEISDFIEQGWIWDKETSIDEARSGQSGSSEATENAIAKPDGFLPPEAQVPKPKVQIR